jgi:hypothetical protein
VVILEMGSCELFAWVDLKLVLLMSAFQVARITGMSHWHLAFIDFQLLHSLGFNS